MIENDGTCEESFIFRELIEARLNKIYEQEDVARQASKSSTPQEAQRRTIPRGIQEVQGFNFSSKCIRELESYLHKRLFIPQQVITHQGTDLQDSLSLG